MADKAKKSRKRKNDRASSHLQCSRTCPNNTSTLEQPEAKRFRALPSQSIIAHSTTELPLLLDNHTLREVSTQLASGNSTSLQKTGANTLNEEIVGLQADSCGNFDVWDSFPFQDFTNDSWEALLSNDSNVTGFEQLLALGGNEISATELEWPIDQPHLLSIGASASLWGDNSTGSSDRENVSSSFTMSDMSLSPSDVSLPSSQISHKNNGNTKQHEENDMEAWLEGFDLSEFLDLEIPTIESKANDIFESNDGASNHKGPNQFEPQPCISPCTSSDYNHSPGLLDLGNKVNIQWKNTFAHSEPSQQTQDRKDDIQREAVEKPCKPGRRQGPLSPENAKRTLQMRRMRACWSCWLMKVPCSAENVCHRCSNLLGASPDGNMCNRSRLSDYTHLFFPPLMICHLQESAVAALISENVIKFYDKSIKINVSSGHKYPPMELSVRQFEATKKDVLFVQRLDNNSQNIIRYCTMPLGLPGEEIILLRKKCLQHIKGIVAQDRDPLEVEFGNVSPVSWEIFAAIERYRKLTKPPNNSLLQKAVMLYAMHYFLGRDLTILNEPEDGMLNPHLFSNLPYDFKTPSRLLNRQIKHVMHQLLEETTKEVLEGLEKELRRKTKQSWTPCFCCILILCICTEELQIAIDGYVVYAQSRQNSMSRKIAAGISQQPVDNLIANCKHLFHEIHRSCKGKTGHNNEREFNPIRDGFDIDEKEGLTASMHDLLEDVRRVIETHHVLEPREGMTEQLPSLDLEDETIASHMDFRKRNSGRLVSDFLRSFFESGV